MKEPKPDNSDSTPADAMSSSTPPPASHPVPKGSGDALSVPGGPNPNVIPG